jgi:hypothetical protein
VRPIPFITRGRVVVSGAAVLVIAAVALAVGHDAGAAKIDVSTVTYKACSSPTRTFNVGPEIDGIKLDHVGRVCADPDPVVSTSAGGGVDPESLHRSNFHQLRVRHLHATRRIRLPVPAGDPGMASLRTQPIEVR